VTVAGATTETERSAPDGAPAAAWLRAAINRTPASIRARPPNVSKLSGERPPAGRTRVRCSALFGVAFIEEH